MTVLRFRSMAPDAVPTGLGTSLWDELRNLRLRPEGVESVGAAVELRDFGEPIEAVAGGFAVGESGRIYDLTTGGVEFDSGLAGTTWSGTVFGETPVFAPFAGVPLWRYALGDWRELPGWGTELRARHIRAFRSHLVAANLEVSGANLPFQLRWSHPAGPGELPNDWRIDDPASDAGMMEFADAEGGEITGLVPFGDELAVLRSESLWLMRYVGPPLVFAFRRHSAAVGARAALPLRHGALAVFTGDDLLLLSSSSAKSLLEGLARRWLRQRYTGGPAALAEHPSRPELWLMLDLGGEAAALVVNLALEGLTVVDLPEAVRVALHWEGVQGTERIWAAAERPWREEEESWVVSSTAVGAQRLAALGESGKLWLLDAGAPLAAEAVRTQLPAEPNPLRRVLVRLVEVETTTRPTITVQARPELGAEEAVVVQADRAWIGVSGEAYDLRLAFPQGEAARATGVRVDEVDVGISV